MKSYRDDFLSFVTTLLSRTRNRSAVKVSVGPPPAQSAREYREPRPPNPKKLWLVLVVALLLLTALFVYGSFLLWASYKPGIGASVLLWGVLIGGYILFFMPQKLITTIFGGLGGIGISELGTSNGLISKANKAITDMANQIGIIVNGPNAEGDPFIKWMVGLFVFVVFVLCIPAFLRDE